MPATTILVGQSGSTKKTDLLEQKPKHPQRKSKPLVKTDSIPLMSDSNPSRKKRMKVATQLTLGRETLFDLSVVTAHSRDVKKPGKTKQEIFIESKKPEFDAILLPIVAWLAKDHFNWFTYTDEALKKIVSNPDIRSELLAYRDQYKNDKSFVATSQTLRVLFGFDECSNAKHDAFIISFVTEEAERLCHFDITGKVERHYEPREFSALLTMGHALMVQWLGADAISGLRKEFRNKVDPYKKGLKFSKITRYLLNGRFDQSWYRDTNRELTTLLHMVPAKVMFNLMAGTSMNAALESNVNLFFKALGQYYGKSKAEVYNSAGNRKINTRFTGFLPAAIYQLNHFEENDRLIGRKISNFCQAMVDNKDAIVVDIWIMRVFATDRKYKWKGDVKSRSPEERLYDAIEIYIQHAARLIGLEPREFCSMLWGGIRTEETGANNKTRYGPFLRKYLKLDDLFLKPKQVHVGVDGVHFGKNASIDMRERLRSVGL